MSRIIAFFASLDALAILFFLGSLAFLWATFRVLMDREDLGDGPQRPRPPVPLDGGEQPSAPRAPDPRGRHRPAA